ITCADYDLLVRQKDTNARPCGRPSSIVNPTSTPDGSTIRSWRSFGLGSRKYGQGSPYQFSFEPGSRHAFLDDPRINLTASPSDRLSAWTGEAVKIDQPHQAGIGPEVEVDVAVLHNGRWTLSSHGLPVHVLRLAEGVPKRAAIGAERDRTETPATKE